jgi:P27 family predicted phage terminase small subunit
MRGRKPKPTAFRLIEGNREHRTIHAELEPTPGKYAPPMPHGLTKPAKKHWKYLIKHLTAMGTLGESDQGAIMAAAVAYGQSMDVADELAALQAEPDPAIKALNGKTIFALRRLMNNTLATMVRFESDLGLNPTARTRIKLDKPHAESRIDRLMRK